MPGAMCIKRRVWLVLHMICVIMLLDVFSNTHSPYTVPFVSVHTNSSVVDQLCIAYIWHAFLLQRCNVEIYRALPEFVGQQNPDFVC